MKNFTLITRNDCAYCTQAKFLIVEKGHLFKEKRIGTEILRETVLEKWPTQSKLPIVLLGDTLIGGYSELLDYLNPPLDIGEGDE